MSTRHLDRRYNANLMASLAASIGLVLGSIGPWVSFMAFTKNGIDGDGVITLALGVVSTTALFTLLSRGPGVASILRWVGPAVSVVCLSISIYDIMNVTAHTAEFFGETIGVQIGWGLWLVALSSVVLLLTSTTVSQQHKKQ